MKFQTQRLIYNYGLYKQTKSIEILLFKTTYVVHIQRLVLAMYVTLCKSKGQYHLQN